MANNPPDQLFGLVDMGSNGIRFSVTDLTPATARSLPTVFQERLGISLYDAQFRSGQKGPIPQDVIDDVVSGLQRFKAVCADFQVPPHNIRVLATEATRNAVNSEDYRRQIKEATSWEVDLLPKEAEGKIGASGVASSFDTVDGLVMDLGGGSTQITWMVSKDGTVETSPKGSFSFPYGAAALSQRLAEIEGQPGPDKVKKDLQNTMKQQFVDAFAALELPSELREKANRKGLTLYLSGGGFRGWGYLLMSRHKIKPYPIPIINGFHVPIRDFSNTHDVQATAAASIASSDEKIFRVSGRRAEQVPAVAFLVTALIEALPFISDIRFCQGGVREGFLFDSLPQETRALSPLTSGTAVYSRHPTSSAHIAVLLQNSLPPPSDTLDRSYPPSLTATLLRAVADTMYVQSTCIKETASASALHLPINGHLASSHGVSHVDRAMLGLILCERWGDAADLPPPDDNLLQRLRGLVSNQEVWWANYLGAIAGLVGLIYPAHGRVPDLDNPRIKLAASWAEGLGKKANQQGVVLKITLSHATDASRGGTLGKPEFIKVVDKVEAVGKKKNRIGGREYGFGVPVRCDIEWV